MIIIPTYNGHKPLKNLIDSIHKNDPEFDHPILIVDNASTDFTTPVYISELTPCSHIESVRMEKSGYELGALWWAYENTDAQEFLVIQDSMVNNKAGFMNDFKAMYDSKPLHVIGLWRFRPLLFGLEKADQEWLEEKYQVSEYELKNFAAIQCNSLYIGRKEIDLLVEKGLLGKKFIPENKVGSCAMERGWGIAVRRAEIPSTFITDFGGINPYFTKIFMNRQ
jgi:hypothetical protein